MTTNQPKDLEQLIRACGEGWIIDSFSPKEEAVQRLRETLEAATAEADRRGLSISFTEETLIAFYKEHSPQVGAFLQALGATRDPVMLVMVWRIIQGQTISRVTMQYDETRATFSLTVVLASPYGEPEDPYESTNIADAALLRHFGIMTMDDKPLFDGFYALKLG